MLPNMGTRRAIVGISTPNPIAAPTEAISQRGVPRRRRPRALAACA